MRKPKSSAAPPATPSTQPQTLMDAAKVLELQDASVDVPLPESVIQTILKLVHSTRPDSDHATADVKNYVAYGAGPRASQCLARAARALALLRGNSSASPTKSAPSPCPSSATASSPTTTPPAKASPPTQIITETHQLTI